MNVLNTLSSSLWTENACSDILQLLQSHQESHIHFRFSPFRERKKGGILWEERRGKGKEKKEK